VEAQPVEDEGHAVELFDGQFDLLAGLGFAGRVLGGEALVGQAHARVLPQPQQRLASQEALVGRVKADVALVDPRRAQHRPGRHQPPPHRVQVSHQELDLDLLIVTGARLHDAPRKGNHRLRRFHRFSNL
jgi:hypothetical protein